MTLRDLSCHGAYKILTTYALTGWKGGKDREGQFEEREVKEKCVCYICGRVWLRHLIERRGTEDGYATR